MTSLTIKLKPGAKRDSVEIQNDGSLAVSVTSRPVEGKANAHLMKLLSKALHIPKSSCSILQGEKSRNKVVAIEGLNKEEIVERLQCKMQNAKRETIKKSEI